MDTPLPVSRHIRKKKCVDGIPKKSKQLRKPGASHFATPDFLSRRFESRIFPRRRCATYCFAREAEREAVVPVDGIRRPNLSSDSPATSFPEKILEGCRTRFRAVKNLIVRSGAMATLSPRMTVRTSLIGAILFGAVSTAMVYRYFGERALAREESSSASMVTIERPAESSPEISAISDTSDSADKNESDDRFVNEVVDDFESIQKAKKKDVLEKKIREMVAGYPIEDMVPFIMEKDTIVAAFLVGIAKKESAWGEHVPLMKSHDCFNYWGYRGKRRLMGTGGHTCFNSPKDAVDTVSRRLEKLISTEKVDTPAEMMVVWKCGYDCSTHAKADTKKWIQDVDLYFHKLDEES